MGNETIAVQVVYALPDHVWRRDLTLPADATIAHALDASGFWTHHPELVPDALPVGIFGQVCEPQQRLQDGERIEIYRSLVFDPMESRRRRAVHRKAFMIKPPNRPKRRKAKLAAAQAQDTSNRPEQT